MKKIILLIIPILITSCSIFSSNEKVELIPYKQKDKYGYFNLEGKIIINPQFGFATAFREDLALVQTTGEDPKWGYINKEGKYVINATYKDATVFQEDLAWTIVENGAPTAIDKKGEIKFTLKEAEDVTLFSEGLAGFSKPDSTSVIWGFVDKSGKQTINPQFYQVRNFVDGKCAVKNKEGKWGYIDKEGKIIINFQFDNALDFVDDKAVVYLDDKAGIIDKNGKYIVNPQFQYASIDGNMISIWQDDKGGWCDKEGKFIINPQFDATDKFGDSNLAAIKSGDKFGFIDKDGKIIINPQFDNAWPFMGDVALVQSGDKFGLIDKQGKYVVNPQFDGIGTDLGVLLENKKSSLKRSITSDYLDVESILKVINIENPENLSLEDNFPTILNKLKKGISDFNAYSSTNVIFESKTVNKNATYGFAIMGKIVDYDNYTYEKYITKDRPEGFFYGINLKDKASGKAEILIKAFENKLKAYTLVKKGSIEGTYTSVYKSNKNVIILSIQNSNTPLFYILKKDFDLSFYLKKMGQAQSESLEYDPSLEAQPETVEAQPEAIKETTEETVNNNY